MARLAGREELSAVGGRFVEVALMNDRSPFEGVEPE